MKIVILLFFLILFPLNVKASICVMDTDTKRLLSGYGEEEVRLIASTTKIMTSLVVINNVDDLNKEIEVTDDVLKSFGSGIYIEVGEHIKIIDLLYGLMLRSGNDAAIMLATYVGGSMEGFASLMNETAKSIGMKNTKFINSSGLENDKGEGNTSTCYDMAILISEAVKNETLTKIMSTKHYGVQTDYKYYDWYNKNKLLSEYKYTTGGKTGYTEKAYRTLVTSATKDNKNLAVVTLNEKDDFENDDLNNLMNTELELSLIANKIEYMINTEKLHIYDKDLKKKNYNPFYAAFGEGCRREMLAAHGEEVNFIFKSIDAENAECLRNIRFYFNHDLTDNIILRGIPAVTQRIMTCRGKCRQKAELKQARA